MVLLLFSLGLFAVFSVVALLSGRNPKLCSNISAGGTVAASLLGIMPCISVLAGGPGGDLIIPWAIPLGKIALHLDPLSAFFLLPIFGLSALSAVFGAQYLLHFGEKKNLGLAWFCFLTLCASMALVVLASNALFFLIAWELTVLSSFFLVSFEHEKEENIRAGWIYLIASHLGTAFLIVMFLLLGRETGSLDFSSFSKIAQLGPEFGGIIFVLAVLGFGTKAGFIPLHVWLPAAHPAAPSHVSCLMSGVMIKTGIYGIVRMLFILGHPPIWWGWTLLLIGLTSGFLGVLFALTKHDLKRLLAYHSVENIGIIALGLGVGLLGLNANQPAVAALGFAGGLLHVINHAVFKGLLFLGAGAVLQQSGTREIDKLGGLLKRMPQTGISFLIGCISISGLPPFNGFISEFLIYFAAFLGIMSGVESLIAPGLLAISGLALIGGLAAACFTKAFSIVFLGSPRSVQAESASEVGLLMRVPMIILAGLCVLIAICSPFLLGIFVPILAGHRSFSQEPELNMALHQAVSPLIMVVTGSLLLLTVTAFVLLVRRWLLAGREIGETGTWDCGYAEPTVTMQYTASSFAQPLTKLFSPFLRADVSLEGVEGYFPKKGLFHIHTPDFFQKTLFGPIFRFVGEGFQKLVWIQLGLLQIYVLYIAVTLLFLLIWGFV